MAAYSAVACFRQTLEQLLDSGQFPELEIQSVYGNVVSLQSSLDGIPFVPKHRRDDMKELQTRIRDAIYAAQDKVEYLMKGHSSETSHEKASFKKIADDVAVVAKKAKETAEAIKNDPDAQNLFSENIPKPPRSNFSGKYKIVGQEEDFKKVTEQLLSEDKQRLVIPITGLPGLGKTTLARSIYDGPDILASPRGFNIRAWVTVSQDFNLEEIFSKILSSMESKNYKEGNYAKQGDEQTLRNYLHQELYNLKYLIVVDDLWEAGVWNRVIQALPDKENGSRVLVTSRIPTVAEYIQNCGFIHEMRPLSLDDSWELLCEKAFDDEPCPPHLKDIGRSIAEKCKGLPLSLTMVPYRASHERDTN